MRAVVLRKLGPWLYSAFNGAVDYAIQPHQASEWAYAVQSPHARPLEEPIHHHNDVGEVNARPVMLGQTRFGAPAMHYSYLLSDGVKQDFRAKELKEELELRHPGDEAEEEKLHPDLNPRFQYITTKVSPYTTSPLVTD
eukprot:scaffold499091_cov15-Prasinocladus_malaysianus.AAC.1